MKVDFLPNFEVMEDSRLMQVGKRGQIILTNQNIRIPAMKCS